MFNRLDDKEWGQNKGLFKRCSKHDILHDPNVECHKCKAEKKPDVFKNIIWLKTNHIDE